ncbi:MAG: FG-GAP-like repeat-containing protein [Planctomycetota bacterium]
MISPHRALVPLVFTLIAPSVWGAPTQDFVENALPVGLDHRFLSGLDRVGGLPSLHDWVQIGIGAGDLDGDGDLDLLAAGRLAPNHLFLNGGAGFTKVGAEAGIQSPELDTCVGLGDWDADGDLDVCFGTYEHGEGPLAGDGRLLRNDGTAVFEDVTSLAGRVGNGHTLAAKFFDLDQDGWLDLYLSEFDATPNQLYRNRGGRGFVEMAAELGADVGGSTHLTGIADVDGDGWFDLSIGNDWPVSYSAGFLDVQGEKILHGRPDGAYIDLTGGSGHDGNWETMGIAWGDIDYDGDADNFRTEVGNQVLLINWGFPQGFPWQNLAFFYGVEAETMTTLAQPGKLGDTVGWGAVLTDLDFDPWLDLFFVCGHVCPLGIRNQHNFYFQGDGPGAGFSFTERTQDVGLYDEFDDRALVASDVDADGDVDLLIGSPGGGIRYFENRVDPAGQGWLSVLPITTTSGPGGAGTRVKWVDSLGYPHTRWVGSDAETASMREPRAHFGLGTEPFVDVEVAFPSGLTLSIPGTPPNTALVVEEPLLYRLSSPVLGGAPAGGTGGPGPSLGAGPTAAGSAAAAPLAVGRRGRVVVQAFAHDAAGTPLGAGANVSIEAPGLAPVGPVQHVGGNEFRRAFAAGTPGIYRVQLAFDGFQVRTRPSVHVRGDITLETTTRLFPEAVRAGSSDTFRVEVVPRDARGVPLGAGRTVSARVAGTAELADAADLGDGRYSALLDAPLTADFHDIDVVVDGALLAGAATLEAGGPPNGPHSLLYFEEPDPLLALNPTIMKVLATPRDQLNRRLGPAVDLQVTVDEMAGTPDVLVRTDLGPNAKNDGAFWFLLEKTGGHTAKGTFTITADGVLLGVTPYQF